MARKTLTFALLALMAFTAHAQNGDDAKRILSMSREKCQSVQQGHYVMERKMKYMSRCGGFVNHRIFLITSDCKSLY